MIIKKVADWIEEKENKAMEEENAAKIGAVGFVEGATDSALVLGLALAVTGWAMIMHDGLHKLSGK